MMKIRIGIAIAAMIRIVSMLTPPFSSPCTRRRRLANDALFWADDLAEQVPVDERGRVRQAVLHLDATTALAEDVTHYDRLHAPLAYRNVPLAASSIGRPTAYETAALRFIPGLLLLVLCATPRAAKRSRASRSPTTGSPLPMLTR